MSDHAALIAVTQEILDRTEGKIGTHSTDCHKYHLACFAAFVMRGLEAVQQTPAVDREALAQLLYESAPEGGEQGITWEKWQDHEAESGHTFVRDSYRKQADRIIASGIRLDAAEVEARGLEKAADHIDTFERGDHSYITDDLRARAQQVREGN